MRTVLLMVLAATTASAQTAAPLTAHLVRPTTDAVTLDLSDKAYVAIFSLPWTPGATPTLLYPGYPNPSPEKSGQHLIRFQGPLAQTATRDAQQRDNGPFTTTIVLIASRTPLDLDSYGRHRTTLFRALGGYKLASSTDSDAMIDRLIHLVAPPGTSVTVDSYTWGY